MKRLKQIALWAAALAALPLPARGQDAALIARPQGFIQNGTTNFGPALTCMDGLLMRSQYGKTLRIIVHRLDEPPTEIGANTRDLLVGALMRMNDQSRRLQIETDPSEDVLKLLPPSAVVVEGSVTAFERDVRARNKSGGIGFGPIGFGSSSSSSESRLEVSTYLKQGGPRPQVMPGSLAKVGVTLTSRDKGRNASGNISLLGGFLAAEFSQNEGPMAALGALIDLAMIQTIGNYFNVPYQQCLASGQANVAAAQAANKAFLAMKPDRQIIAVATELSKRGKFAGPVMGRMTPELRSAIANYQREQGLVASGEISFELYQALTGAGSVTPAAPGPTLPGGPNPMRLWLAPASATIVAEPEGTGQRYLALPGDRLVFALTSFEPGHAICYYVRYDNETRMIFPSDQRNSSAINPRDRLLLPGPGDLYQIVARREGGAEFIRCISASEPLEPLLPERWKSRIGREQVGFHRDDLDEILAVLRRAGAKQLSAIDFDWQVGCRDEKAASGISKCSIK